MAKAKTSKAAAKRFKITGTGRILRRRSGARHLLEKKRRARKLRLSLWSEVHPSDRKRVRRMLLLKA